MKMNSILPSEQDDIVELTSGGSIAVIELQFYFPDVRRLRVGSVTD